VAIPTPEPGLVISYSFLWSDEAAAGHVEGRKTRPCAIVLVLVPSDNAGGAPGVYVAPVTHSMPPDPEAAVEMPMAVKRHLGLDQQRSWVVLEELNAFVWPGYDLRPIPGEPGEYAYGLLPPRFFETLRDRLTSLHRTRTVRSTKR
jgi:hypothetical protein